MHPPGPGQDAEIRWQRPADRRLHELSVVAKVVPDVAGAFRWTLRVEGVPAAWSVWQVRFPQLAVADLGPRAEVLLPRGPGELQHDPWQRSFKYRGTYPSGWTSMQLLAAYDAVRQGGPVPGHARPAGEHEGRRRREPAGGAGHDVGLRAPGGQHGRGWQRFRVRAAKRCGSFCTAIGSTPR